MIGEKLNNINERISGVCKRVGRDASEVTLVAVSKRKSIDTIKTAIREGQQVFGENYFQEAREKIEIIGHDVRWHFIGHLQSNKAKQAAMLFDCIETVDRFKLAAKLDGCGKRLDILLQVNIGGEQQKSGISPEDAPMLARQIGKLDNIRLMGLMTIPPYCHNPEAVRPYFRKMKELATTMNAANLFADPGQVTLSMGMSGDFEIAIEEGATLVRVGTALFGARDQG